MQPDLFERNEIENSAKTLHSSLNSTFIENGKLASFQVTRFKIFLDFIDLEIEE